MSTLYRPKSKDALTILLGSVLGYAFFHLGSHPTKSPLKRRLPKKQIRNYSYFPNIHINREDRYYHLHHWMVLSSLYLPVLLTRLRKKNIFKYKLTHGFLLGSILQGLTYNDRFRVVYD
ncbi:MAG TPA: hypothetical protein VLF68_00865, partial [Candidatus Saccharimonadales bacterium]|nr:hypothetical protein [Candidatus Saccharimonadales bacterium]